MILIIGGLSRQRCLRLVPYLHIRPAFVSRTMASLPSVDPPLSNRLPTDSYQLLSTSEKGGPAEESLYQTQVEDVQKWWASERYQGIRRTYSAEDVVSKRGSLQQTHPSSLMARKLFNLLKERSAARQPVHTSGLSLGSKRGKRKLTASSGSH